MEQEWFNPDIIMPEEGEEVLGYNKEWIDEDFNPDGICVCYATNEGYWDVAKWCGLHYEWHTRPTGAGQWEEDKYEMALAAPTHWRYKPEPPLN